VSHVVIALGSNIAPGANLREAVQRLAARVHLIAVSPVYETKPVGKTDQPNFLNAAALIETQRGAAELKDQVLSEIEQELGRTRTADKNAPRTIDLDITLYGDQVFDYGGRHIPDPDLLAYPHVAVPAADVAPTYRHPETGQTLYEIADGMPKDGLLRRTDLRLWDTEAPGNPPRR
jgi:2-amino-4-hydroxy-6-hydroxymethyldihydropteridine diphosphokinase